METNLAFIFGLICGIFITLFGLLIFAFKGGDDEIG